MKGCASGRRNTLFRKMSSKIAMKECYGCRISVRQPLYYDGDGETAWCSECFVTEEQLEAARRSMPCWQALAEKPKKKVAIRLVKASVAAAPSTVAAAPSLAAAPPSEPSAQLAPASSPPLVQKAKKKPVLMAKVPAVLAAPPSALPAQPQKKKPVFLKKVAVAVEAQSESSQASAVAPPPVEKKKPRLCKKNSPPECSQSPA